MVIAALRRVPVGAARYCAEFYDRNFKGARMDGSQAVCDAHGHPLGSAFFAQSSFGTYAVATERNAIPIRKDVPLELMGRSAAAFRPARGRSSMR